MTQDTTQVLFRTEYEQELESWFRRRFGFLCYAYIAAQVLVLVLLVASLFLPASPGRSVAAGLVSRGIVLAGVIVSLSILCYFFFTRRPRMERRDEVLAAATQLILGLGTVSLAIRMAGHWAPPSLVLSLTGALVGSLFLWHISACAILPWTPGESLRPMIPLLLAWDLFLFITGFGTDRTQTILSIALSPVILLPGLGICAWRLNRHRREFKAQMVGRHFVSMRRELAEARRLHESMFPAPFSDQSLRFEYTYSPMRELGGDFVHLHVGADGLLHLALIDVTGHGLAAAITVSRLYGELERIRAESPGAEPEEVVRLLNQYVNLTLARHGIFATALCLAVDPYEGVLRWCNAGHPPGFRRGINGVVTAIDSTTMMLGPLASREFEAEQRSVELCPGDVVLVYTDGAIEARNRAGRRFGIQPLRELLLRQPAPRDWAQFVVSQVGKYAAGKAEDDVLVAAVTFLGFRYATQPAAAARHSPQSTQRTQR